MEPNLETRLWTPGQKLEYEPYDDEHLLEDWSGIYAQEDNRVLRDVGRGILGAIHMPEETPEHIASIDLCDVLRQTHLATARVIGKDAEHIGRDIWIYTPTLDMDKEVAPEIVKAVMNANLVEPVEEIHDIREIIQDWKEQGVYVVANTSTLPNCERATIENLLAKELPGCFDGIVLPRNHYGDGTVTKGDALRAVVSTVTGSENHKVGKAVHIDDAPHHISDVGDVLDQVAEEGVTIMPVYQPGPLAIEAEPPELHPSVIISVSPFDAFEKASRFFSS